MDKEPTVIDLPPEPPSTPPRRWDDVVYTWWSPRWRRIRGPFWVLFFLGLFLLVWLFDLIFVNIYPGHAGVIWRRFDGGTDMSRVYQGGMWVVNPFNKMYVYETRMQQRDTEFTALSNNGLIIRIRATVRFRPEKQDLPRLHEELGPDYVDRVVIPQVQSVIRKIIGAYEPDQIYGTQGNILQNVVLTAMGELRTRYIELDDLLIREILLPDKVAGAIENKLEQEQLALQFAYILDREKQEAERKQIEARGIQEFQRIVSQYLDDNYLRLRGIAATIELARSANAKIVVFGNNPSGLPLILNTGDAFNAPTAPAAPPVAKVAPSLEPASPKQPAPTAAQPSTSAVPPVASDVNAVSAEVSHPSGTR